MCVYIYIYMERERGCGPGMGFACPTRLGGKSGVDSAETAILSPDRRARTPVSIVRERKNSLARDESARDSPSAPASRRRR